MCWLRSVSLALASALFCASVAFGVASANEQPMILPPDPVPLVVETNDGKQEFTIEIADEPRERERGLMFRQSMEPGRGMLFVFENTQRQGFWMKNTPLPLDLLFIAENGRLVAIRRGEPFSEALIAPIYPVRFVLELNAGTARERGIRIGARLRHPVIDAISGAR